jgi:hypothetical protein
MRFRIAGSFSVAVFLWVLVGCGNTESSSMNKNNTPNGPTTTTGTDNGSASGSTPAPSPATTPDKYLATFFFADGHDTSSKGTIAIDSTANDGAGKVELSLGSFGPNSTFTLQFCPDGGNFQNCFDVGTVTTDSAGNSKSSFVFPRKGTFSGVFTLNSDGTIFFYAGINTSGSEPSFSSKFLPMGAVGGSASGESGGIGTVLVVGQTGHITLHGAAANHTYDVAYTCGNLACQTIGTLTTNGQGNGSVDVPVNVLGFSGGIGLTDSSGVAYVRAFRVN